MTKDYFCEKCFFFKTSLDFSAKMYPWHLLKRESKLKTTQRREPGALGWARLLPRPTETGLRGGAPPRTQQPD